MIVKDKFGNCYKLGWFRMSQIAGEFLYYTTARKIRNAARNFVTNGTAILSVSFMPPGGFEFSGRTHSWTLVPYKLTKNILNLGCREFSYEDAFKILKGAKAI